MWLILKKVDSKKRRGVISPLTCLIIDDKKRKKKFERKRKPKFRTPSKLKLERTFFFSLTTKQVQKKQKFLPASSLY